MFLLVLHLLRLLVHLTILVDLQVFGLGLLLVLIPFILHLLVLIVLLLVLFVLLFLVLAGLILLLSFHLLFLLSVGKRLEKPIKNLHDFSPIFENALDETSFFSKRVSNWIKKSCKTF